MKKIVISYTILVHCKKFNVYFIFNLFNLRGEEKYKLLAIPVKCRGRKVPHYRHCSAQMCSIA